MLETDLDELLPDGRIDARHSLYRQQSIDPVVGTVTSVPVCSGGDIGDCPSGNGSGVPLECIFDRVQKELIHLFPLCAEESL